MAILHSQGESRASIARRFEVTEGAVRYRLKRRGARDRRADQPAKADGFAAVIAAFMDAVRDNPRGRNLRSLHDELCAMGYAGSYGRLAGWVRKRYPPPPLRPFRRVETPPGAQSQADWFDARFFFEETQCVRRVHGLLITLSHSRGKAVVWRERMTLADWLHGHNECYRRLGGVPAVERIDNLRTAVADGAGAQAAFHPAFKAYAKELGFHIEACRPRTPTDKGKVERAVRTLRASGIAGPFRDLSHLQADTDAKLARLQERLTCPATGLSVADSLRAERALLRALPPALPVPFTHLAVRTVGPDCTIRFCGRQYSVPFRLAGRAVQARACADGRVRIYADDAPVAEHPLAGPPLALESAHYEGRGDDRVLAPVPLGATGALLERLRRDGVEKRSIEIYERVARLKAGREVTPCAP